MSSTDIDGSAILILSVDEAVYLASILCLNSSYTAKSIMVKCQEVLDYEVRRLKDGTNKTAK